MKIMKSFCFLIIILYSLEINAQQGQKLSMNDSTLKEWQSLKYGMFIHFGMYSEAGGIWNGEKVRDLGEQIKRFAEVKTNDYHAFSQSYNPDKFDPDEIVALAKRSGMKYIILTSKHHDGFCMWDTKTTDFNIVTATPYKNDAIKLMADACKKGGIRFGIYFSLIDWDYPGSIKRVPENIFSVFDSVPDQHHQYSLAQVKELLSGKYGDMVEVFFDMSCPTLKQSKEYMALVKQLQPNCLVNGRVMNGQGDFITMPDNAIPDIPIENAWEAPSTFYHWTNNEIPGWNNGLWDTWAFKLWIPRPDHFVQVSKQLRKMVKIISRGGNFLLNVGPTGKGEIISYEADVLKDIGEWLSIYGESIFNTLHDPFKHLEFGNCTYKPGKLYFHFSGKPDQKTFVIPGLKNTVNKVYMLADYNKTPITFTRQANDYLVTLPEHFYDNRVAVMVVEYKGDLQVIDPLVEARADGTIELSYNKSLSLGNYSGMMIFASSVSNILRYWDFSVPSKGKYQLIINYTLDPKINLKTFVIKIQDTHYKVTLQQGENQINMGIVELKKTDRTRLSICSEQERFKSDFTNELMFTALELEKVSFTVSPTK